VAPSVVVVLVTCPSREVAERIAKALLEARLAACVNITPELKSIFWWKGEVEEASEVLMFIKTKAELLDELIARVRELHPYEVPEVIALPVAAGLSDYLAWVEEETKRP